ncbi:MAG: hypothetical protein ACE5EC_05560, partial [Phycisphaerae bacterium]
MNVPQQKPAGKKRKPSAKKSSKKKKQSRSTKTTSSSRGKFRRPTGTIHCGAINALGEISCTTTT